MWCRQRRKEVRRTVLKREREGMFGRTKKPEILGHLADLGSYQVSLGGMGWSGHDGRVTMGGGWDLS